MPLLLPTLQNEFINLLDQNSGGFVGFGANPIQVANNWANVVFNYASSVLPPSSTSTTAKSAMVALLIPGVVPGAFIPALISAFTSFATILASGMAPTYTGVPPIAPINFAPILALPLGTSVTIIANLFATIVDTWFRTGTAILVVSPYTVVPWS